MPKLSLSYRLSNLLLACVQNMTMGGILFGWASISGSLLPSTIEQGGAGLNSKYINVIFIIASSFSCLGPILLGFVLDLYGPRVCSILSTILIIIGLILFAISDKEQFPMFIPAMSLVAFGGPGVQNAIIHVSNLFPTWKSTATAIITGSFQLSFIIFFVFDQLWVFDSWNYRSLFLGYSLICIINIGLSATFWPDIPFDLREQMKYIDTTNPDNKDEEDHYYTGLIRLPSLLIRKSYSLLRSNSYEKVNNSSQSLSDLTSIPSNTFYEQVFSVVFIRLTIFFIVNAFWTNFYVGTMDIQLGDSNQYSIIERLNYDRLFTIIMTFGFVSIPVVGLLMDHIGFPVTSLFIVTFGLLWSLCLLSQSKSVLVLGFLFYSLFRTFLFTFIFAFAADTMGFKYFGMLIGIMFVFGGFVSLLQYPIAQWATGNCHEAIDISYDCDNGKWVYVNIVLVLCMLLTYIFCYQEWIRRRNAIKKMNSQNILIDMNTLNRNNIYNPTNNITRPIKLKKDYGSSL